MASDKSRLIVSFIGGQDLKHISAPPDGPDRSPVLRLLEHLARPVSRTRLLLFDDHPENNERRDFCEQLKELLPQYGIRLVHVEIEEIVLPGGPTDRQALYERLWAQIPTARRERPDEVVFHLSSGTPAMQQTLVLAAHCLPLKHVRLFETSRERGAEEVQLPYVLAAREVRGRRRGRARLSEEARRRLLPETIVHDPAAEVAYAAIWQAMRQRVTAPRLLVMGPSGSGKWHACRQFAHWRGGEKADWLDPSTPPLNAGTGSTVLIRHLEGWPADGLKRLTLWAADHAEAAIAATYRTDHPGGAPLEVVARDGLRGATHVALPALNVRTDVVALGEALARQLGIHDGKLRQRLQYDWVTDVYPRGLHDLMSLMATAAAHSPGLHPEADVYREARERLNARLAYQELLDTAWKALASMNFAGPSLGEVLDEVRLSAIRHAYVEEGTQTRAAARLGISQQAVSDALRAAGPRGREALEDA